MTSGNCAPIVEMILDVGEHLMSLREQSHQVRCLFKRQISAGLFSTKWSFGMLPRCSMCIHVLQSFNSLLLRHPSNEALQWETQELLDVSAVWGCQALAFLSFTTCHETKQTCTSLSAPRFGQMITQEIASSTVVWQLFVLF